MDRRDEAKNLRKIGLQLIRLADDIEHPGGPPAPVKSRPDPPRLICPDCGMEYAGPEYRNGDACMTVLGDRLCQGWIARKSTLAHLAAAPDEPLVTTDGRSLGVTRDQLAASQAAQDAAAEWQSKPCYEKHVKPWEVTP